MMREISIFTGSTDIERALGLLQRTAARQQRDADMRVPLDELARWFGSERGRSAISTLATDLGLDTKQIPQSLEIRQLFDDELLSARALKLHRGRDVYSGCKQALWEGLWVPFRDALTPDEATLALIEELVALQSVPGNDGLSACCKRVEVELRQLGFRVESHVAPGSPPVLVAHRPARGCTGHVAMYGHYDVEPPNVEQWRTDPWQMTEVNGRLYGAGIGDNKAALAHRLVLLRDIAQCPAITWVIQGEEEVGSPLLRRVMSHWSVQGDFEDHPRAVWVDENGYFDVNGTQRMLARTISPKTADGDPPDRQLWGLIERLNADLHVFGLDYRLECRGLNKSFFPQGCPFNNAVPVGARYLAIGVNDPASGIHQANESVPMWTFPVAARQFRTVLKWAADLAEDQR